MTVSSPSQHLLAGQLRAELSRRAVTDRVAHAGLALDIEPFGDLAKLSDSELAKRLSDCRDDRIEIDAAPAFARGQFESDRKSTRLNSSHGYISYAVFCLK